MAAPQSQRQYWSGKVGGEWAAHADRTDSMLAGVTEAALDLADFRPGERVLDIGCGAGQTSYEIARRTAPGGAVLGVDISPQLLAAARTRARAENVRFVEADAQTRAWEIAYDAAFSRFGVMFFEDPIAAFANLRAALRPKGRMVFVCWRTLAENPWSTVPIEALKPMLKAPLSPADPDAPGPFAFADAGKLQRILKGAGWREAALARWDGDIPIGGGGAPEQSAEFLLRIGPAARAIADHGLDPSKAKARLTAHLKPHYKDGAVRLAAACWIVSALA